MELSAVVEFIGTVGFPIVAWFVLFDFQKKTITSLQETVNKNTEATNKLLQYMEFKDGKGIDGI